MQKLVHGIVSAIIFGSASVSPVEAVPPPKRPSRSQKRLVFNVSTGAASPCVSVSNRLM